MGLWNWLTGDDEEEKEEQNKSNPTGSAGGLNFISRDILDEDEEEEEEEQEEDRDISLQFRPSHGPYLRYDRKNVTLYDAEGQEEASYPATSGIPGVTDQTLKDEGPIPSGRYLLDPGEISEGGFMRNMLGDWGSYRAPLHPQSGTETHKRSGFFLHGGEKPGSAGCIDVGDCDDDLFPRLNRYNKPLPLWAE